MPCNSVSSLINLQSPINLGDCLIRGNVKGPLRRFASLPLRSLLALWHDRSIAPLNHKVRISDTKVLSAQVQKCKVINYFLEAYAGSINSNIISNCSP